MKGPREHSTRLYDGLFLGRLLSSTLLVLALVTVLLACGPSNIERHTLAVNGTVHVYPTDTPPSEYPGSNFIDVVGPQEKTTVTRVVYRPGYMAVKIKLSDGREGWVFSGENIELR